jgi:mRNA interferase RelE/StbE
MTYSLEFDERALKEWRKLGDTVREQLKKKLASILLNPRIEANRLHSLPDCYVWTRLHCLPAFQTLPPGCIYV